MARTFVLAISLLASAAWLQAQSQYPQTGSSQKGATASGQTTVEGCLQGSDGNYTLTDNSGTMYQLKGDTSKLSAHVGHEIPITGTPTTGAQQATLTVQNMKHISKTCKSTSPK